MSRTVLITGMFLAVGLAVDLFWGFGLPGSRDGAVDRLSLGRQLYTANCASCHGANLEGQPNWKSRLPSGRLPAPPHNASGHTWHHPDGVLFRITKEGPAAVVGDSYESNMPGFGEALSDAEIWAVLEWIKGTWPERERKYQTEISAQKPKR